MPPSGLFHGFERGDPDRDPREYTTPSAEFASPADMKASRRLAYAPGKIFLGVVDGEMAGSGDELHVMGGAPIGIMDDRHLCTVAGSRSGKGRAVLLPTMLDYPGSVLATDPKGELATITAKRRKEGLGQSVFALDPFGVTKGYAANYCRGGFNPVAAMRDSSLVEDAALIADALVVTSERDPHWDESARTLIEGVTLHVRTWDAYKTMRSLVTVRGLIGMGAADKDAAEGFSMAALVKDMMDNSAARGVVQIAANDFWQRPERERASVLSTARRHLKFIDLPGIQTVLQTHSFDLDDLKAGKTTVYLCLPARHIATCRGWLRLFVNLALQAMERTGPLPAGRHPVLFVLDEFAQLGRLAQVESAAGQIAGFGVKLWVILQDLGQLKDLYKDRWESFLGNAGVLQFFGNNDLTTLEWISKRCGRCSVEVTRQNPVTSEQARHGASGTSSSLEHHELISVEEASRLFSRDDTQLRQLVIWAGRPPLVLQRAHYDTHELFKGKFGERP